MHDRHRGKQHTMGKMGRSSDTSGSVTSEAMGARPDGEKLFVQYCSSCHGTDASGMAGAFPPLTNSRWVTRDKATPIKILLHGVQGSMEVQGETYGGSMTSFGKQLSAAEIASILNYLRDESDGDYPEITKEDVKEVQKEYADRDRPWNPRELLSQP